MRTSVFPKSQKIMKRQNNILTSVSQKSVGATEGAGVGSGVSPGLGSGVGAGVGSGVGSTCGGVVGNGVGSGVGPGVGSGVGAAVRLLDETSWTNRDQKAWSSWKRARLSSSAFLAASAPEADKRRSRATAFFSNFTILVRSWCYRKCWLVAVMSISTQG